MDRKIITDALEIIPILINGYNKNANVLNAAKRKVYAYARYIGTIDDAEKTRQLSLMLNHEHVYVKYWGGVIALSYNVMKKQALVTLISILDTEIIPSKDAVNFQRNLQLNLLKADVECVLYDYKKYGLIGSYPEQYADKYSPNIFPNAGHAIKYFRRMIKKSADF